MKKSLIGKVSLIGLASCVFSLTGCLGINEPNITSNEGVVEQGEKKKIVTELSNIKLNVSETKSVLSWDAPLEENSFTVSYNKTGSSEIKTIYVEGTSVELSDLEYGSYYDFLVKTNTVLLRGNSKATEEVTLSNVKNKIHSDVLFLMYMDGDNNLNDSLFIDINEVEYGLSLIRNKDNSPKPGMQDVNVIALWDGFAGDNKTKPRVGDPNSHLYRLGADSDYTPESYTALGSYTVDLSSTASWLSSGEVNMGDRKTLVNYYKWAMNLYDADYIYLHFSNHGGGTRDIPVTFEDEFGFQHDINNNNGRAMCWDEGSGDSFLKCMDLPLALEEAGMPKVDIIMEDVCLGANIEEAYELRNYADYFLASPNNIPNGGFDYVNTFKYAFCEGLGPKLFGYFAVNEYKNCYTFSKSEWEKIFTAYGIDKNRIKNYDPELLTRAFGDYCSTLSYIDLSKLEDLKDSINIFVEDLLANEKLSVKINDDGEIVKTKLIGAAKNLVMYSSVKNMYQGTFVWQNDLGFFLNSFIELIKDNTDSKVIRIKNEAIDVQKKLDAAILYSWKDGYQDSTYFKDIDNRYSGYDKTFTCGLTISGGSVRYSRIGNRTVLQNPKNPKWYKTDLQFGKDCKWNDLLTKWFGEE